jgi:uncharacterized protein with FMN-binding domain
VFPKRGAFAVLATAICLVLLLNFKTVEVRPDGPEGLPVDPDAMASYVGSASAAPTAYPTPAWWLAWAPSPASATSVSTGSPTAVAPTPGSDGGSAVRTPATRPVSPPTPEPTPAPTPAPPAAFSGTIAGPAVWMVFGPVQVQVTFSNGRMTDIVTLQTPTDSHSLALAKKACPILRSEALAAQSASVNTVSGATYTSQAYLSSLQGAIDLTKG